MKLVEKWSTSLLLKNQVNFNLFKLRENKIIVLLIYKSYDKIYLIRFQINKDKKYVNSCKIYGQIFI